MLSWAGIWLAEGVTVSQEVLKNCGAIETPRSPETLTTCGLGSSPPRSKANVKTFLSTKILCTGGVTTTPAPLLLRMRLPDSLTSWLTCPAVSCREFETLQALVTHV